MNKDLEKILQELEEVKVKDRAHIEWQKRKLAELTKIKEGVFDLIVHKTKSKK